MSTIAPTASSERLEVLDGLRGFALFGILLANLLSFFGVYTYSPEELVVVLPTVDRVVLFVIDWFVEGKFYGIFSILFGVGFALQVHRFQGTGASFVSFWYRRMMVLIGIGLFHMYVIWNGDILTLYGVMGLFLPFFMHRSNLTLYRWIAVLLLTPWVIHLILYFTPDAPFWGSMSRLAAEMKAEWGYADRTLFEGRASESPREVFLTNVTVSIPRAMSYLISGRYFKVLGLFLIGIVLARQWLPKIRSNDITVPRSAIWIGLIGLVCSFGYAWIKGAIGSPFEVNEIGLLQAFFYQVGSVGLALGIAMAFVSYWSSGRAKGAFSALATLGRMALTNYILQNVIGVIFFFGYGFALTRQLPFALIPIVALAIVALQWVFSRAWLSRFKQGPLEWVWRTLTYRGK